MKQTVSRFLNIIKSEIGGCYKFYKEKIECYIIRTVLVNY